MDTLEALRDIHLPDSFTRFPLGWGVLMFLFLLIFFLFAWPLWRHFYHQTKKYYALEKIKKIKERNVASLCLISEILRRICLVKHKDSVSLFGKQWRDFLCAHSHYTIDNNDLTLLANAPYVKKNLLVDAKSFEQIKNFAKAFVEDNL